MKKITLLLPLLILCGCALFQETKFEPGGAYAATETAAAMPELYAADSAYDLADKSAKLAFKYERDNRMVLWSVSPAIKHKLDSLRPQVVQVQLDYAIARQAYLRTPVEANLSALQTALGKLQQLNTSVLTVIATKGEK